MSTAPQSRRERKKLATRRIIRREALKLFQSQGYSATTVDQIAESADVAPMTFYRHFGNKEAVVVSVALDDELTRALTAVHDTEQHVMLPVDKLLQITLSTLEEIINSSDENWLKEFATRASLSATTPELTDALWRQSTTWTQTIATHLPTDGLTARTQARAIIGAYIEAVLDWPTKPDFPSHQALIENLSEATTALTQLTRLNPTHGEQAS